MQVCDSAMFIFLWKLTRKSKTLCFFLTVHVHHVSVRTQKHILEHMHTFMSVYYGMCFGTSCCVERGLCIM